MKISEPLWRDSNSQLQYRDIVLHSVVHMCDFRRNSYHSGSHRGSSSSCAGAHVDEILNYLKTKVSPILGHIFPVFQLLINLGAELNHQDRATGWTCLMQVPKIIVQSLVTFFWFINPQSKRSELQGASYLKTRLTVCSGGFYCSIGV